MVVLQSIYLSDNNAKKPNVHNVVKSKEIVITYDIDKMNFSKSIVYNNSQPNSYIYIW